MKALVLYGAYRVRVEDRPVPEVEDGWVLVKTEAVGICGTDKAFYRGSYTPPKLPIIPGHEAVGRVVAGPSSLVGARIVTEINLVVDWSHPYCRMGAYTHAPPPYRMVLGIDFDGAMAEYFKTRIEAVHVVGDMDPLRAVYVEPLAAVLRALSLEPPRPGWRVAVMGTGPLALLAFQVLERHGCRVEVIARRDSPKKKYFERLGARIVDLEDAIRSRVDSYDAVFEATGSPDALDYAVRITRPLGVVYLKSTHGMPVAFNQTLAVVKELRMVASRCGTFREFEEAIRMIRDREVDVVVTSVYPLEEGEKAFKKSLERSELKVVVKPS